VIAARTTTTWAVSLDVGDAGDFQRRSTASVESGPVGRALRFWRPEQAALVIGSAQPDRIVGPDPGVAVVRRRTGGGAVYLVPGQQVWADVTIPAGDPHWEADIGRAFWWVGDVWAAALVNLGVPAASVEVHRSTLQVSEWSPLVCFAGVGSGEVTIGGRKVVGMSQRRTRHGTLFQCVALLGWDPHPMLAALALSPKERDRAEPELRECATPIETTPGILEAALAGALLAAAA
jgi:lipoate-protein ligase A